MTNRLGQVTLKESEALIWYLIDVLNADYAELTEKSPKFRVTRAQSVLANIDSVLEGGGNSCLDHYQNEYGGEMAFAGLCERRRKIREVIRKQINK